MIAGISGTREREVADLLAAFRDDRRSRWFYVTSFRRKFEVAADDWSQVQRVSVEDGRVVGFLEATVDRETRGVSNLSVVNFEPGNVTFAMDLRRFMLGLVAEFVVVRWSCVSGSPNEELWGRAAEAMGGRRVGMAQRYHRMPGGELADAVFFEVLGRGGGNR